MKYFYYYHYYYNSFALKAGELSNNIGEPAKKRNSKSTKSFYKASIYFTHSVFVIIPGFIDPKVISV